MTVQTDEVRVLLAAWTDTLEAAGATAPDDQRAGAGADLVQRWCQPHRHYHDLEHLAEVLAAVEVLQSHAADPAAVRLAAWFHDAVYDGLPGLDEAASAALAEQVLTALGVPVERAVTVGALVRMTADHQPAPDDPDAAVLSDADLAVLASSEDRYRRYAEAVRAEYQHVPLEQFRSGRAAVLRSIADRAPIYATLTAVQHWEGRARENLAAELNRLQA